jgi:PilZ domain
VPYRTMDWSLGGFSIKGSCPMLEGFKVGDEVTGSFGLPGCPPEHEFSAVVTRIDAETYMTGFKFSILSLDGLKMLENLLSNSHQLERSQGKRKLKARRR